MRPDASRRPAPTGSPGPDPPGRAGSSVRPGVPPPAPVAPVHLGGVLRGSADHQVLDEATQPVVAAAVPVLEGRGAACTSCTHAGLGGITSDTARKDLSLIH